MNGTYASVSFTSMFDACEAPQYTEEQLAIIQVVKADVVEHFTEQPKRLKHIEGVALCARCMAQVYGADPFICEVAGYLHDWDKYLSEDELIAQAQRYNIDMGVELQKVVPLLHGKISACKLKDVYPELPSEVFDAIDTHTTGCTQPSVESAIVYTADLIEPSRPSYDSIERIRSLVGTVSLDELYLEAFKSTLLYLIQANKYVWPQALVIYNELIK